MKKEISGGPIMFSALMWWIGCGCLIQFRRQIREQMFPHTLNRNAFLPHFSAPSPKLLVIGRAYSTTDYFPHNTHKSPSDQGLENGDKLVASFLAYLYSHPSHWLFHLLSNHYYRKRTAPGHIQVTLAAFKAKQCWKLNSAPCCPCQERLQIITTKEMLSKNNMLIRRGQIWINHFAKYFTKSYLAKSDSMQW